MNFKLLKNLNLTQKMIAVCAVFIISALALVFFLIMHNIGKVKEFRAMIITQKMAMDTNIDRESNAKKLSEKLEKIKPELEKFDQIFINQNRELEFITTLEDLAVRNNIEQKINFDFKIGANEKSYRKVPLEITAKGGFRQIVQYLNAMEALSYYINVRSLDFISEAGAIITDHQASAPADGFQINLRIAADTYWK